METFAPRRTAAALLAAAGLVLALRSPGVDLPLDRDEGGYAYIAQRWLLGEVPYKESFDQKPPGIYAVYALVQRLFGESPRALRGAGALWSALSVGLIFLLGRRMWSLQEGAAAAGVAGLLLSHPALGANSCNTELFMAAPLAGALLLSLGPLGTRNRWAFWSGVLSGLACLFKPVGLTNAAVCLFACRAPGPFFGGFAAAIIPVMGFLGFSGAFGAAYDAVIGYNLSYGSNIALSEYPARFWGTFSGTLGALWPLYALAALPQFESQPRIADRRPAFLGGCWLLASLAGAAAGGYFREHYFLQCAPALALLAGRGAVLAVRGRIPAVAASAAAVLYGLAAAWGFYGPGAPEEKARRLHGYNPFPESPAVAGTVAARSGPKDTVFVFGSEPQILFLSKRKSATRYIYSYPLLTSYPETGRRQVEAMEEVRRNRPKFIVTVFASSSLLASPRAPLGIFQDLKALIARDYQFAGVVAVHGRPRPEWLAGPEAERLWAGAPMWYDRKIWGSLALWERKPDPDSTRPGSLRSGEGTAGRPVREGFRQAKPIPRVPRSRP